MESQHSIESLLKAAAREGLILDPSQVKVSESGLDFFALFARDNTGIEWVVRAPRRDDVIERAQHEMKVLSFVKPRLNLQVPDWRIFNRDIIAYPKLSGAPIGEIDMQAKAYVWKTDPSALPEIFVRTSAEALARLHQIPVTELANAGIEMKDMAGVRRKFKRQIEDVHREISILPARLDEYMKWIDSDLYWPTSSSFTHGDFHPGHMLVDNDFRLTGILDWTEGEVSDPTIDLSVFAMIFGETAYTEFLKAYQDFGGTVSAETLNHTQKHIAAYPVKIALFGMLANLAEYREMAKHMLQAPI